MSAGPCPKCGEVRLSGRLECMVCRGRRVRHVQFQIGAALLTATVAVPMLTEPGCVFGLLLLTTLIFIWTALGSALLRLFTKTTAPGFERTLFGFMAVTLAGVIAFALVGGSIALLWVREGGRLG